MVGMVDTETDQIYPTGNEVPTTTDYPEPSWILFNSSRNLKVNSPVESIVVKDCVNFVFDFRVVDHVKLVKKGILVAQKGNEVTDGIDWKTTVLSPT